MNDVGSTLTSSHHVFIVALKFFQTIVYNGRESESLLQTRINMYEKQINQSSLRLIPDRSSLIEHLKRATLQTNIWLQCMKRSINYDDPLSNGCKQIYGCSVCREASTEDGLKPGWFTCPQLPPSLKKTKSRKGDSEKQQKETTKLMTKKYQ